MARPKVFFIYFENADRDMRLAQQKERYHTKGIDFIPIQYTEKGFFEPDFPDMDAQTKIIFVGHGHSCGDKLDQKISGGNSLSYQAIADKLQEKRPSGGRIKITLIACYGGMGDSDSSHDNSFAGKLFKALVDKGFEPEISAGLSGLSLNKVGRIIRQQKIRESFDAQLESSYAEFFESFYQGKLIKNKYFEEMSYLTYPKALSTKVRLKFKQENADKSYMDSVYLYGCPKGKVFDISDFSPEGVAAFNLQLKREAHVAEHMAELKESLEMVLNDFEKDYPEVERIDQYLQLRIFLLEDRCYFDAKVISEWIKSGDAFIDIPMEHRLQLAQRVLDNQIIKNFNMDAILSASQEKEVNLDFGYFQFGLAVVHEKILGCPTPIPLRQFKMLNKISKHKLAVEIGKKMLKIEYDEDFVKYCLDECAEKEEQLRRKGIDIIENMSLRKELNDLDHNKQQRLAIELGKQAENFKCDVGFLVNAIEVLTKMFYRNAGMEHVKDKCFESAISEFSEEEKALFYIEIGKKIKNHAYNEIFLNQCRKKVVQFYCRIGLQFIQEKDLEDTLSVFPEEEKKRFCIELGKKIKGTPYDELFVNECMEKIFEKEGEKVIEATGMKEAFEDPSISIVKHKRALAIELGKRAKGEPHNKNLIKKYSESIKGEIEFIGWFSIIGDECVFSKEESISFQSFTTYLDAEQQKEWEFLVGKTKFNIPLSEKELTTKADILEIVRLSEGLDDVPGYRSSPLNFFQTVKMEGNTQEPAAGRMLKL